jgi:hypothetical protein
MSQWGFDFLRPSEVRDSALLLRRYLSHSKFSALIAARSLYFAPASSFRDETEGHYTEHDYETWDRQLLRRGFDDRARALASSAKANVARGNRQAVVIIDCCINNVLF